MACFIVPGTEAIVSTIATKVVEKHEAKKVEEGKEIVENSTEAKIPFSRKMKWLNNMLWGGSGLLAFEHVWHGEVVPWEPFLTNAANPADLTAMLHEMATTGVAMSALVTAVWGVMLVGAKLIESKDKDKLIQ